MATTEIPSPTAPPTHTAQPTSQPEQVPFEPNIFLVLDPDGGVTIRVPRSEMGQGVRTALPMIVAEELEADWATIRVEQAPADRKFGDQSTGGSRSVMETWMPLRRAGAIARQMLIAAAASIWSLDPSECQAHESFVVHLPSDRQLAYSELIDVATDLPVPDPYDVPLKDEKDFRIIGTNLGRVDNPEIVSGRAVFGTDVRLPGMLYSVVARCPVIRGRVAHFDAAMAEAVAGVRHVLQIDSGVAVVADNTWAAIRGREALELAWEPGSYADLSSVEIEQELADRVSQFQATHQAAPEPRLEATYATPFQAHVPMEPINCTADARDDRCEVWVPTQNPQTLLSRLRKYAGLPDEALRVNVTLIGGGFGRRLEVPKTGQSPPVDHLQEAVQISRAIGGPVQVLWTRDDDLHHDLYHPMSYTYLSALQDQPDRIASREYECPPSVPTGYWRAVENVPEAFAHESFLDELAWARGEDPYQLRRQLLPERSRAVLEMAAQEAGWGDILPERWGRGIAFHNTWGVTPVAQVAEVSVSPDGMVRVHRVVCAIDCGLAINPDIIKAQMEGGIIFGLSAALKKEITIESGQVQQSNFHDYPILRMDEAPVIEVFILPSEASPTGVGEMGVPPIAPAVTNAIFAATGIRIRRLPIRTADLLAAAS